MREQWIVAFLIVVLISLTVLYPSVGWIVQTALFQHSDSEEEYRTLMRENQALRAAASVRDSLVVATTTFAGERAVSVFSRYPLNFKNELLVNSGSEQGTNVGDIALIPVASSTLGTTGIFVGKVIQVFSHTALIETVFDSGFESAARIGSAGIDTFLRGGNTPRATLVQRRAGVKRGEIVYLASPSFPYGLAIGTINEIVPSKDNVFDEATLEFGYDINHVTAVHLIPAITQ